MVNNLSPEEMRIALALLSCPESELYRGSERMTLAEIGALLGMTREGVRQIERKALDKLKAKIGHDEMLSKIVLQLYKPNN